MIKVIMHIYINQNNYKINLENNNKSNNKIYKSKKSAPSEDRTHDLWHIRPLL